MHLGCRTKKHTRSLQCSTSHCPATEAPGQRKSLMSHVKQAIACQERPQFISGGKNKNSSEVREYVL